MAPSYKLIYFATRGWAEPIRFLFSYGNIDFEDFRFTREEWPQLKERLKQMPFGFVPVLEHDGKKAGQSIAIARYVAKLVGLTGKNDWEDLEIDAIVDTVKDFSLKLIPLRFETDENKKKELKEKVVNEILPFCLKRYDALIEKNNGFLAAGRLTWADFYFVSLAEKMNAVCGFDIIKEYPRVDALMKKILEMPQIKKYIEKRAKLESL